MKFDPQSKTSTAFSWRAIPNGVWALGFVSLFMDVSSEMIHALLPIFLVSSLGASVTFVGVIEGIAEATASIVKVFSGLLSDWLGRRKLLAVLGYGLGALSKPLFPLATSAGLVLAARLADRIGKGIRGAPRDALVADLTSPEIRGAAYGLRQSLDTIGAFGGPLLAIALMTMSTGNLVFVFWIAVIPAFVSVAILLFGVRDPARPAGATIVQLPISFDDLQCLGSFYWKIVFVGAILTLARFSEAFLVLRALDLRLTATLAPLVLVIMNTVYGLSAYPVGVLSDRKDPRVLLMAGFGVLLLADIVLASAGSLWMVLVGAVLWGLHMGITQGLLATLVAQSSPAENRGTAFGIFHLVSGVALLLASVIAGLLWDTMGANATFLIGAGFTVLGLLLAFTLLWRS